MKAFYRITQRIKDILASDEDVHTVLFGVDNYRDLYKKIIYPVAHINPVGTDYSSSQQNVITLEIAVLDIRDFSKHQPIESKFLNNDNEIDTLNTCHAVLNRLIATLRYTYNDGIEILSVTNAVPVRFKELDIVDGWLINLTLAIPNTIDVCIPFEPVLDCKTFVTYSGLIGTYDFTANTVTPILAPSGESFNGDLTNTASRLWTVNGVNFKEYNLTSEPLAISTLRTIDSGVSSLGEGLATVDNLHLIGSSGNEILLFDITNPLASNTVLKVLPVGISILGDMLLTNTGKLIVSVSDGTLKQYDYYTMDEELSITLPPEINNPNGLAENNGIIYIFNGADLYSIELIEPYAVTLVHPVPVIIRGASEKIECNTVNFIIPPIVCPDGYQYNVDIFNCDCTPSGGGGISNSEQLTVGSWYYHPDLDKKIHIMSFEGCGSGIGVSIPDSTKAANCGAVTCPPPVQAFGYNYDIYNCDCQNLGGGNFYNPSALTIGNWFYSPLLNDKIVITGFIGTTPISTPGINYNDADGVGTCEAVFCPPTPNSFAFGDGNASSSGSCSGGVSSILLWTLDDILIVGTLLYEEEELINLFPGGNIWYKTATKSYRISGGVVQEIVACPSLVQDNFSLTGRADGTTACGDVSYPTILFTNTAVFTVGLKLYTNTALTTPFPGNNLWYHSFAFNKAYKFGNDGAIQEIFDCTGPCTRPTGLPNGMGFRFFTTSVGSPCGNVNHDIYGASSLSEVCQLWQDFKNCACGFFLPGYGFTAFQYTELAVGGKLYFGFDGTDCGGVAPGFFFFVNGSDGSNIIENLCSVTDITIITVGNDSLITAIDICTYIPPPLTFTFEDLSATATILGISNPTDFNQWNIAFDAYNGSPTGANFTDVSVSGNTVNLYGNLNLLEVIPLYGVGITGFDTMSGLHSLITLDLDASPNYDNFDTSVALTSTTLGNIYLNNCSFLDFNPTFPLPSGEGLILSDNDISVFDPVQPLPDTLKRLFLDGNSMLDFNPVNNPLPPALEILSLSHNELTLLSVTSLPATLQFILLQDNNLETFNTSFITPTLMQLNLIENALDEASVNAILIACVDAGWTTGKNVFLSGGTNACPTGAGITARDTLMANGVTLTTNCL